VSETDREELVEELERRIDELESLDDDAFGGFTRLDWVICTIGALALPYLALLWFAG
jgi:hypothetical protein